MTQATLDIQGMRCSHCLNAVNRALAALPGVEIQSVRMGQADVRFDEKVTDAARLEAAVADAGYQAKVRA
jgi:copper chaperone CopZ